MCRLAWVFACCLCDKYHNLMSWLIYVSLFNSFYLYIDIIFLIYIDIYFFSVYFIFIYAFFYFTSSKLQSIYYSNLHSIISNLHYENSFVSSAVLVDSSPSGGSVCALAITDVTVGIDVYDDPVYLFLHCDVSLPVFLLDLSNMLATGWPFMLTNVFYALFDECLYTGLPEMEISSSDVDFQIRPYHLNGVKIRMVWWEVDNCVFRWFENVVHSVHWSWLVHFTKF